MKITTKIIGFIAIAAIAAVCGCLLWQSPPDGGDGTLAIKNADEATGLLKEKYPELNITEPNVKEIPGGWGFTLETEQTACSSMCVLRDEHNFMVYENRTIIKTSEGIKEIDTDVTLPEKILVDIPREINNSDFYIRIGQVADGKIWGQNFSIDFKITDYNSRIFNLNLLVLEYFYVETQEHLHRYHDYSQVFGGACPEGCSHIFKLGAFSKDYDPDKNILTYDDIDIMVAPVKWIINGSDVRQFHNSWNTTDFYVNISLSQRKYRNVEIEHCSYSERLGFIDCYAFEQPVPYKINETETKNFAFMTFNLSFVDAVDHPIWHNITINYLSKSPKLVFEVIIDGKKDLFEVDPKTDIMVVNEVEKGETCEESSGYMGGRHCGYSWQRGNIEFGVTPISLIYNQWGESMESASTWNTTQLSFGLLISQRIP